MNKKPVFEVGQVVEATGSYMWQLTEGKKYMVTKYEPEVYDPTFTWPAYVTVIGDMGKQVTGHTHRFRAVTDPVEIAIYKMNLMLCPLGMDLERFEKAKALKARIWRKEVSASMSGIEYLEPEATWLAEAVAAINCTGEQNG